MKKWILAVLAVVLVLSCGLALAADSKGNKDIAEVKITEVEKENEDEDVTVPEPDIVPDPKEVEELREELRPVYVLTIIYIYEDGTEAAPPFQQTENVGDVYSETSPTIPGFQTGTPVVSGEMPARDMTYTVVYMAPKEDVARLLTVSDYEVPLGLGFTYNNLGICFE